MGIILPLFFRFPGAFLLLMAVAVAVSKRHPLGGLHRYQIFVI